MGKYVDLSGLIDVEPSTHHVLELIEDDDLMEEFNNRANEQFLTTYLAYYCEEGDLKLILGIINELLKK